jgi:hypothetical protein
MENTLSAVVTTEGLSRIRKVARNGSVQRAVNSLLLWGGINIVAWFILGTENRDFLSSLTSNPDNGIYFLLYGGLLLGSVMLVFALFGFITLSPATIILDGISLLAVGVFNIIYDFVAMSALRPYGYTVEQPGVIWIMLGASQVVWGFRQFSAFGQILQWSPANIPKSETEELKRQLKQFVGLEENEEDGIIKASSTVKGPLGLSFMTQTTTYTGRLLPDAALMISDKLDNCFKIDRKKMHDTLFTENGSVNTNGEGIGKELVINPSSVILIKQWCDKPVNAADIMSLANTNSASLSVLKHYLYAKDFPYRPAVISVISTLSGSEAKSLVISALEDSNVSVFISAIDACRQMKIDSVHDKILPFSKVSDPNVRIAVVRYIAAFPTEPGRIAFEQMEYSESDPEVRKEIVKCQKIFRHKILNNQNKK